MIILLEIAIAGLVLPWSKFVNRREGGILIDVTGTGAVAQLRNRVSNIRVFVFLVRSRTVVVSVARSAVWLILGRRPGDILAVYRMAGIAIGIARMIPRVGSRHVIKNNWLPVAGEVASVTFQRGNKMARRLAYRGDVIVTA